MEVSDKKYNLTIIASFCGSIVQAVIVNFVPLLFVTFQKTYGIPLSEITLLITVNFVVQLTVDFLASKFVDKIGYKTSAMIALALSALGLIGLTFLPDVMPDPFAGLVIPVIIYAIGGGLLEVLVSPIVESCPTDNKEKAMSLLHSFYCWGQVGVVLISTLYFTFCGIDKWKYLAIAWAVLPIINIILFIKAPVKTLLDDGDKGMTLGELCKTKVFWVLIIMMLCAGASEQAVGQWASTFAETGLGVSKTMGDLLGPMMFAALMGIARAVYGKFGDRMNLDVFMTVSAALCVVAYLFVCLIPNPIVNLVACGVCGFSVGMMWPGTFSKASAILRRGGTALFAMLALAGDLGCVSGPTLVGAIASATGEMKIGILCAVVFPAVMLVSMIVMTARKKKTSKDDTEQSTD